MGVGRPHLVAGQVPVALDQRPRADQLSLLPLGTHQGTALRPITAMDNPEIMVRGLYGLRHGFTSPAGRGKGFSDHQEAPRASDDRPCHLACGRTSARARADRAAHPDQPPCSGPMTQVSAAPDGTPTPEMTDYYTAYARGGFGLPISEDTYTTPSTARATSTSRHRVRRARAAWLEIIEQVHAAGSRIVIQLMHAGALSQGNCSGDDTAGPSAVPPRGRRCPSTAAAGRWANAQGDVPGRHRDGSERLRTVGGARQGGGLRRRRGDAVGYLVDQFITDYTNLRDASYGGPLASRVRLAAEVVAAIRAELRAEFCVGAAPDRAAIAYLNTHLIQIVLRGPAWKKHLSPADRADHPILEPLEPVWALRARYEPPPGAGRRSPRPAQLMTRIRGRGRRESVTGPVVPRAGRS